MAVTNKPWNGAASKYPDTAAYCKACLIDENPPGKPKTQDLCKLPVREPNGDLNANGLRAAVAVLQGSRGGVKGVSVAAKRTAARAALRLCKQAGITPGDMLKRMAGQGA